jgi:predicted XRE-type DNA-binding protein
MDALKRKRLQSNGWQVSDTKAFLGLNEEEATIIELKLALATAIKSGRSRRAITQDQLGRLLGSSQSRVAKMEAADRSVSIDLMLRTLLRMGASRRDLASYIAANRRRAA